VLLWAKLMIEKTKSGFCSKQSNIRFFADKFENWRK
jgi:hypothetical protein